MPYLDKDFKPTVFEYTNVNDYNRLLVYYPRKGGRGVPSCDFTYELLVTPTPTPTSSITPTITPTSSITPTITPTSSITPTPSITPTLTPTPTPSSSAPSIDPDAAAYLADVVASGGTTNPTIEAAVDTLFTSLKSAGLYSKLDVFYPFVGGVGSSHAINAKLNKTYDLTYNGGITHDVSGSTGNGTNGWASTQWDNTNLPVNDYSFGVYQYTEYAEPGGSEKILIGQRGATSNQPIIQLATKLNNSEYFFRSGSLTSNIVSNGGNVTGFYIGNRTGSTTSELYRNGNLTPVANVSSTYTNTATPYHVALWNFTLDNTTVYNLGYSNQGINFAFMGDGLSATDITNLSNTINTFQTSLGRNTY